MEEEIRLLRADELEEAFEIGQLAFHSAPGGRATWLSMAEPERLHGLFQQGRMVAMLHVWPLGQYFGGRAVPMGGVASVAVTPEDRGHGAASRLLAHALATMHERGECISTLFPASASLYRGLGWEVAGAHCSWRVDPRDLLELRRPDANCIRRARSEELPELQRFYEQGAPRTNGFVERGPGSWRRLERSWDDQIVSVMVDESGEIEGYIASFHEALPRGADGDYAIRVFDWMAKSARASAGLWWTVGSSSAQSGVLTYPSSPEDPLMLALSDQRMHVEDEIRWMTRIVDAGAAIAARGFPPGVEIEVALEIEDDLLTHNAGRKVLTVSKEEGRLEPGGSGELRLDIRGLAALYTGWASSAVLEAAGLLRSAREDEGRRLDAAFAGPTPWMLEQF